MVSVFCYLALSIFMINRVFSKITNLSNPKMLTYSSTSIFLGLCSIPFNIAISRFLQNTVYKYMIIILVFIVSFIILILSNIKYAIKSKSKSKTTKKYC